MAPVCHNHSLDTVVISRLWLGVLEVVGVKDSMVFLMTVPWLSLFFAISLISPFLVFSMMLTSLLYVAYRPKSFKSFKLYISILPDSGRYWPRFPSLSSLLDESCRQGAGGVCTGDNIHFLKFTEVIKECTVSSPIKKSKSETSSPKRWVKLRNNGKRFLHKCAYAPCSLLGISASMAASWDSIFGSCLDCISTRLLLLQEAPHYH